MGRPDLINAPWRTSTHSGSSGTSCVEVAPLPGAVAVRDSKNRAGGVLAVTHAKWDAFLRDLRFAPRFARNQPLS